MTSPHDRTLARQAQELAEGEVVSATISPDAKALAAALRELVPQMREDAECHRTWTTEAARVDLDGRHFTRPVVEVVGDAAWHERWVKFYDAAADTMERAAECLLSPALGVQELADLNEAIETVESEACRFANGQMPVDSKQEQEAIVDGIDALSDRLRALRDRLTSVAAPPANADELARLREDDDAERWRWFADSAKRETTSNGDNAFVRYVGEWVVAEAHRDPEDGDYLTPQTPYEWIDAARAAEGATDEG